MEYVGALEKSSERQVGIETLPLQPDDAPDTDTDVTDLDELHYKPASPIEQGFINFVAWYREYFKV